MLIGLKLIVGFLRGTKRERKRLSNCSPCRLRDAVFYVSGATFVADMRVRPAESSKLAW